MIKPKIIQSLWTAPLRGHAGWCDPHYFLSSMALSFHRINTYHHKAKLVTDSIGRMLLCDALNLEYSEVNTELDTLTSPKSIWTSGKVHVYETETTPFVHIDGDVMIDKPVIFDEEGLYCQHIEEGYNHNEMALENIYNNPEINTDRLKNLYFYKDQCNAGIMGGSNGLFFKLLSDIIKGFIIDNFNVLMHIDNRNFEGIINTVLEQNIIYSLAKQTNMPIRTFIDSKAIRDDYKSLVNMRRLYKTTYIHPVGYLKGNPYIGECISRILFIENNKLFERVKCGLKLLETINRPFKSKCALMGKSLTLNQRLAILHDLMLSCTWCSKHNDYPIDQRFRAMNNINLSKNAYGSYYVEIPSIFSNINSIMFVKYQIGPSGWLLSLILNNFNNRYFSINSIFDLINVNDNNLKLKIEAAFKQLINIGAIVIECAESEKP